MFQRQICIIEYKQCKHGSAKTYSHGCLANVVGKCLQFLMMRDRMHFGSINASISQSRMQKITFLNTNSKTYI